MSTDPSTFPQMNAILFPEGTKFLHWQGSSHEAHFLAKLPNGTFIEIISHGSALNGGIDMESFDHATLGMGDMLESVGLKLEK